MYLFSITISIVLTVIAFILCKKGKFYSDTPFLFPLGIYVWGDALVLAPTWGIVSLFAYSRPNVQIFSIYLLFMGLRSFFEVIYWLLHQFSGKSYNPPLFRNVGWIKQNEVAILYQLLHTLVVVGVLAYFMQLL
jgi:hypothetical protein